MIFSFLLAPLRVVNEESFLRFGTKPQGVYKY